MFRMSRLTALRVARNTASGNDWINLKLVGVRSNRPATGARMKVTVKNEGKDARAIDRTVGGGGSCEASPFEQYIGLGKSAQLQSIEVGWLGSGTHPYLKGVAKNQFWEIREDRKEVKRLERKLVPFHLDSAQGGGETQQHSLREGSKVHP